MFLTTTENMCRSRRPRAQTLRIAEVTGMSLDNVELTFDAAICIRIVDAQKAVMALSSNSEGGNIVREVQENIQERAKLDLSTIIGKNRLNKKHEATAGAAAAKADGAKEGGGLLTGGYFAFDVHRDVGQCGDRRRLCGHGFTLFGLDRLLTGALGVELEAEAAHHLVHLTAEVGRLSLKRVLQLLLGVGGQWRWRGIGSGRGECRSALCLVSCGCWRGGRIECVLGWRGRSGRSQGSGCGRFRVLAVQIQR